MGRYETYAPRLVAAGYDVTPCVGKRPILPGWSSRPDDAKAYSKYPDSNIGTLMGGQHNLIAIDVDVLNPFCSIEIQKLVGDELGEAPRRVGKPPKFLMLFRCTEPQTKTKTGVYAIEGDDCAVEVLAEGQQFIAAGIHPDTRRRYEWPDDSILDTKPEALTEVTPDALRRFLAASSMILARYGDLKGRVSERGNNGAPVSGGLNLSDIVGEAGEIEAAMAYLPNSDEHYDDWVSTLYAIKGARGEDGRELAHRWSARSSKYDEAETNRTWDNIHNVKRIGAGSIYHWAGEHGFDIRAQREPREPTSKALPIEEAVVMPTASALTATPLAPFSPVLLPPRPWLFGDQLLTNYVSAIVAAPGVGKSTLTIQFAIAVALGVDFADYKTHKQGNVWIYNNEDDLPEMQRRVAAAAQVMNTPLGDLFGKLHVNTGDERQLIVARSNRNGDVIQTPDVEALIAEIQAKGIVLLVVDPFAETHAVAENSNDDIKMVAGMFRRVAKEAGCSVLLVHHTRKAPSGYDGGQAGNMDSARGASAFLGVCRVVSTLVAMSKADAEQVGIPDDEKHLYVRLDNAKANLSLMSDKATWFARRGIEIGNGDIVGALAPWKVPGIFDGITSLMLLEIQKAVHQREVAEDYYLADKRSTTNWIGLLIIEVCGEMSPQRVGKMMSEWVENGALKIEQMANKQRKLKASVVVGEWVQL